MEPLSSKYDALVAPETSIIDLYATIIDLKKSEAKVKLLISVGGTEEELEELTQIQENVAQALEQEMNTLKQKESETRCHALSLALLSPNDIGKLAKVYVQSESKWRFALVEEVDIEEQTAQIRYFGKESEIAPLPKILPAYYLKVIKDQNPELFEEGTHCKALYSVDGCFYPCIIESISPEGYHIRYKKYDSREIVPLYRLKPTQATHEKPEEVKFEDLQEFKIPEKLKIQPNDPESIKKAKKAKLKALKFSFKNAQLETVNAEKKQKWQEWNKSGSKMGYFKTKHDLDVIYHHKPKP